MRQTIFALLGAIALMGCGAKGTGGGDGDGDGKDDGKDDGKENLAPAFPEGTGQQAANAKAYPAGPYGVGKGSTIANYKFVGYANAMKVNNALQGIELADFYNPTGTDVFAEGSVYDVGSPKPKAILIDVASVWCGPCNFEADKILPGLYAEYHPKGGEFLLQLADGPTPGKAATSKSLYNWTSQYDVNYPATIDPTYKLGALFDAAAYPSNFIIDARTMKIVEVIAGAPQEGGPFWKLYEKVLAGTN